MNTVKLDKRLLAIENEITGSVLADIGTDHGKLIVKSLLDGKAQRAIAVDISAKSLHKAKELADFYGLSNKIEFIVGDGLTGIEVAPDTVVIAGLGGNEIVGILEQKSFNSHFVFAPHQFGCVLRKYLNGNGFCVQKDFVIKEGRKYYEIITAVPGKGNYSESEIYIGKNYPPTKEFVERLLEKEKHFLSIISVWEREGKVKPVSEEVLKELKEITVWKNTFTE